MNPDRAREDIKIEEQLSEVAASCIAQPQEVEEWVKVFLHCNLIFSRTVFSHFSP